MKALPAIVLGLLLAACTGEEFGDLKAELKDKTKDLRGRIDPLPVVKPYEPVPYKAFDQPDLQISCPRRETSTHALQALELMNGKTANRLADAFAERLRREAGTDNAKQVELAYSLALGRVPTAREKDLALAFLQRQPLREFALAMFNVNGFLYVN